MKSVLIKERLHRFIETIEEKRVKAIYALFEREIEEEEGDYSEAFKKELDRRYNYYISGGKMVTKEEADKRIKNVMKKIRSK
jgi:hypothetical protein